MSKAAAVRAPATVRQVRRVVPGWLIWASLVLAVIGLAVSAYLTYEHYTASTTLSCPDTGVINCLKVTQSQWSTLFGVPVALLGLLYYVAMVVLNSPPLWRSGVKALHWARLGAATGGLLFVFYLLWAELFKINNICLWCTGVHIVTFLLFALIALGETALGGPNGSEYDRG